jgi:signal transduction histidine kinase
VLDGLTDAVFLLDGGRIRMANRALAVMFRLRPGDLTGRELADVGLPASVVAAIASRLGSSQASSADLGPDPFLRYHRVTVVPLGASGGDAGTLVAVSDLTERMRLDAVRRDFVANASHELKTPVAAMLLLAESAESAAEDGDAAVVTDRERLRRILENLVDNAVKYTPAGGHVVVTTTADPGGAARIEVRDDGPGIEPEHRERVFERFYRVDKARSRELGGTGLGLAIVKHLAESIGAQVTLDSEPGRGSRFSIVLPAAASRPTTR